MSARHVLERLEGVQVIGWAVAKVPIQLAGVMVLIDGNPVATEVKRHSRGDVAESLGLGAEVFYGYTVALSPEIWDVSGQLRRVQISAGGITLDLPHAPDIPGAIQSLLSKPPSIQEIGSLAPLLAHLNSMVSTPRVQATRERLGPLLNALGWHLTGPWDVPEAVQGYVDRFEELRVEGWVKDTLTSPCRFNLWPAGSVWSVHAHRVPRPDLNHDDVSSGFALDIPAPIWADLPNHAAEIKLLANGQVLGGQTVTLDVRDIDSRVVSTCPPLVRSLAESTIGEQLRELRWINHALALHRQGRLSASASDCLMNRGVSEGLFVAPLRTGLVAPHALATSPDSALWQALKSLNSSLLQPTFEAANLEAAIANAPLEVRQRLLLAITPWSCVNELFPIVFAQIAESTWLSLASDHSPWADSVALPWMLRSHRVEDALQACERLAQGPSGWLNTECLRWSMEALCGRRPREVGPSPAWGAVRHALLSAVLCAGSCGERQHDHHILMSLWTWLAQADARNESDGHADVSRVLSHQGLNPSFWAGRDRLGLTISDSVSVVLDQVFAAVSPLLRAPPSQWTDVPAATQALIGHWCEQPGTAGREVRRIVREWACHLSTLPEITPSHAVVSSWIQRLGPTEALRWRQAPLIASAALPMPDLAALAHAYQLPDLSAPTETGSPSALALRVVWVPEAVPHSAPDDALGFEHCSITADWADWKSAISHASPSLPPLEPDQSLAMRWLRAIAWFVECTDSAVVCILPWSGHVHIPTLLQLLAEGPPAYCGPNDQWLSAQDSPVSLSQETQISLAKSVRHTLNDPTGCLLTRATAKDLIKSCTSLLARDLMAACVNPDQLIRLLLAELGIRPHALSHTWLQPRVVEHRYAWERAQLLPSLTLWPTDSSPSGPSPNAARTLRLLSTIETLKKFGQPEVVVVCVVRNEIVMLPHFLHHYRRLGIDRFIFIDNLSDDGTTALLLAQPDAIVYSAEADYRVARYGVTWQLCAMAHHAMGKWVIAVDADELLVIPQLEDGKIRTWLQELDRSGYTAAQTPMVDMLPQGPLSEADFAQQSPFEVAPFIDQPPVQPWRLGSGQFSNQASYVSALRHRLAPNSPPNAFTSQKIPLFRYQPWIHLADGLHYASNVSLGRPSAWLAHFKYHSKFALKVQEEVVRQQHFEQAAEYRIYAQMISETGGLFHSSEVSRRFDSTLLLEDLDETC